MLRIVILVLLFFQPLLFFFLQNLAPVGAFFGGPALLRGMAPRQRVFQRQLR